MKIDKTIQILMSTYNGERYIKTQLESFIKLKYFKNIKVLIRDDGSTDNTVKILDEYRAKYGFNIIKGKNVGVNKSIQILFDECDLSCDYFALSDQDDYWLEDKFDMVLKKAALYKDTEPLLFSSCSQLTDELLHLLNGTTIIPKKGTSFFNAMIQNVLPGHTQVFNRALMNKLIGRNSKNIHVIDWWIYLVASGTGTVIFDKKCTVLHRQHNANVVGYENNIFKLAKQRFNRLLNSEAKSISKQLLDFQKFYENEISYDKKEEIENYFESQKTTYKRFRYTITTNVYRQKLYETLMFKILYILGFYNI